MNLRPASVEIFLARHPQVMLVRVAKAKGSTPRETGTYMLVSSDAMAGTIGGGQLEFLAIDHARNLLSAHEQHDEMAVPLGPGIGQCCGGHVRLAFQKMDEKAAAELTAFARSEVACLPEVLVFGAGHVGKALAAALAPLPFRTSLIDTRPEELRTVTADVEKRALALPEAAVRGASESAIFVAVTHDHALDFMITGEALKRQDASYVGMIGSKTKRVQFERWFLGEGGTKKQLESLICPIGGGISGDKTPEIIAVLTIAEIIGKTGQQGCPTEKEHAKLGEISGDD